MDMNKETLQFVNLEHLGFNCDRFCERFAPTFYDLSWDDYDVRLARMNILRAYFSEEKHAELSMLFSEFFASGNINPLESWVSTLSPQAKKKWDEVMPFRQRAVAQFDVTTQGSRPYMMRKVDQGYLQDKKQKDYRGMVRYFAPMKEEVVEDSWFQQWLLAVIDRFYAWYGQVVPFAMAVHQVSVLARQGYQGYGSPEGIHQDGADCIVSALVIERHGVTGGESRVYHDSNLKKAFWRKELQEGEMIFQSDALSHLWHEVTPIQCSQQDILHGRRSIFGIDFKVYH
jgi:hypothetical protein